MPDEKDLLQENNQQHQEIQAFQQEQDQQLQRSRSMEEQSYQQINQDSQDQMILRRANSVHMDERNREERLRKNVKERKINQIIENAHVQGDGDSDLMIKVKETVRACNILVYRELESDRAEEQLDEIERSYMNVIAACHDYCDHRNSIFDRGKKRKMAVENTLQLFQKELSVIPKLREMNKTGQLQQLRDENINTVVDLISKISLDMENAEKKQKNKKQEEPLDPLQKLTYNDLEKLFMGGWKDELAYRNNKIIVIRKGLGKNSRKLAKSADNMAMIKRFAELLADKESEIFGYDEDQRAEAYKNKILKMKSGQDYEKSEPVLVRELQGMVKGFSKMGSETERMAKEGKDIPAEKHAYAVAIKSRLSQKVDTRSFAIEEENIRKQLKTILKTARKNNVKIPDISDKELNILSVGQYYRVQDRTLHCLLNIQKAITNLNGGKKAPYVGLAEDKTLINNLLAYNIVVQAADSEGAEVAAKSALSRYMTDIAFKYCGNQGIGQAFERTRLGSLIMAGDTGLSELVIENLGRKKNWTGKTNQVMKGMKDFQTVCREMVNLSDLQKKAVNKGLSAEEAESLRNIAQKLDKSITDDWENIRLVARELKGTRFYHGYEALKELKSRKDFSFITDVSKIAEATLIGNPQEEQRQTELEKKKIAEEWLIVEEEQKLAIADKALYQEAEQAVSRLSGNEKKIAQIFTLKNNPSDFIRKAGDEGAKDATNLYTALRDLSTNAIENRKVIFAGTEVNISVNKNGQIQVQTGKETLHTPYSAKYFFKRIELDASNHVDKYGLDANKVILMDTMEEQQPEDRKKRGFDRRIYLNILRSKLKMEAHEFRNVTSYYLAEYAKAALMGVKADELRILMDEHEKKLAKQPMLNEQDTLEVIQAIEQRKKEKKQKADDERVVISEKHQEDDYPDEIKWKPEEEKIKTLFADILFTRESWMQDLQQKTPGERLREALYKNIDTIRMIMDDPAIISNTFAKLKMPGMENAAEQIQESLEEFTANIKELRKLSDWLADTALELILKGEDLNELPSLSTWDKIKFKAQIVLVNAKLKADFEEKKAEYEERKANGEEIEEEPPKYETFEEIVTKKQKDAFEDMDKQLDDKVGEIVDVIQNSVTSAVKNVFDDKEGEQVSLPGKSLEDILKDNVKGQEGQGKFFKLILTQYFSNATMRSKRSMLASAFRDVKPSQLKEPVTDEEKEQFNKFKEQKEKEQQGSFLGGFLKGAGPLLHKILQGLPMESLPLELKTAVEDMKSNLAPIADEIVKARMDSMIERSYGSIARIDVVRSLGAASVGQAFLCKIYGPALDEKGKDVVIKLLRPNVQNQIAEESRFMLEKAKEVDTTGGMLRTYIGQLESIEREMDLRNEAENVKHGELYNNGSNTVESMKLVNLVEPEANSLMLEKASGTTVDKYLKDIKTTREDILKQLKEDKIQKGDYETFEKLCLLRKQLFKRQKYIVELSKKWVTEGIYDSGFYHGDLHAGNIMIDDEKATVIDFGNATQVTKAQQECIMHMVCAAESKSVVGFRDNFRKLLIMAAEEKKQKDEEVNGQQNEKYIKPQYRDLGDKLSNNSVSILEDEQTRRQFEDMLDIVFHKEGDTGSKIAVALMEAQKMGLELPASVYNFSQCQIRLRNTIQDMNKEMELLDKGMKEFLQSNEQDDIGIGRLQTEIVENIDKRSEYEEDKKNKKEPVKIDVLIKDFLSEDGDFNQKEFLENLRVYDNKLGTVGRVHKIITSNNAFNEMVDTMEVFDAEDNKELAKGLLESIKGMDVFKELPLLIDNLPESVKDSVQNIKNKFDKAFAEMDATGLREAMNKLQELCTKPALGEELNEFLSLEEQVKKESGGKNKAYSQNQIKLAEMAKKHYQSTRKKIRRMFVSGNDEEFAAFEKSLRAFFKEEGTVERLKYSRAQVSIKAELERIKELRANKTLTEDSPEISAFMNKLQEGIQVSAENMQDALNAKKTETPKTFYDAMGEVIENRKVSTILKLGWYGIWNYQIKSNEQMSESAEQAIKKYEKDQKLKEKKKEDAKLIKEKISVRMKTVQSDIQALNQITNDEELAAAYGAVKQKIVTSISEDISKLKSPNSKTMAVVGDIGAMMVVNKESYDVDQMFSFAERLTAIVREIDKDLSQLGWNEDWAKKETWQLNEDTLRRLNETLKKKAQ